MRESDVRKTLKGWFNKDIYWIEQAAGGTTGFFDSIIGIQLHGRRKEFIPIEAKAAQIDNLTLKGHLNSVFRPSQLAIAHQFTQQGMFAAIIIGQKDPNQDPTLYSCTAKQLSFAVLEGRPLVCTPTNNLHQFTVFLMKYVSFHA